MTLASGGGTTAFEIAIARKHAQRWGAEAKEPDRTAATVNADRLGE